MPKVTATVAKDALSSAKESIAGKSCPKTNGLKKNEITNDHINTINDQENGTNSGHSSSNESNNIDKRKKGIYLTIFKIKFIC